MLHIFDRHFRDTAPDLVKKKNILSLLSRKYKHLLSIIISFRLYKFVLISEYRDTTGNIHYKVWSQYCLSQASCWKQIRDCNISPPWPSINRSRSQHISGLKIVYCVTARNDN